MGNSFTSTPLSTPVSDALADTIESNAQGPRRAQNDMGSMEQHSLPDQIAADRYLRSKAASKVGLGIRLVKLIPPGMD